MKRIKSTILTVIVALLFVPTLVLADVLPSWHKAEARDSIIQFVEAVTKKGGPDYVQPAERIAVFDNDGTLWVEQPLYTQLYFSLDRIKVLAKDHPEWKSEEPFKSALAGDLKAVMAGGREALGKLVMATHSGVSTEAFSQIVKDWMATAKHPRFKRPFTDLVYQPMLELLDYLRSNGFKTFIVSGGGIEFMRPWTEAVYGIPPEQVIGSSIETQFQMKEGKPVLMRLPQFHFVDDKEGKPVGIQLHIGRRPIAAFGNSDGDLQMLQWTSAGNGKRFCLYVHHTDADREWAYDRDSGIGRLDKGLQEAQAKGWTVADMKKDWKRIFSFEK